MVFLLTDSGEYRELPVPSVLTVGRDPSNSIRPESQSVSKKHAQLVLKNIPNTEKVEAWLEDLDSRNGTFAGSSLLDIEKINGKVRVHLGDYIRFGHAQKFFRFLESIPRDAESLPAEIVVSPTKDFQQQLATEFSARPTTSDTAFGSDSRTAQKYPDLAMQPFEPITSIHQPVELYNQQQSDPLGRSRVNSYDYDGGNGSTSRRSGGRANSPPRSSYSYNEDEDHNLDRRNRGNGNDRHSYDGSRVSSAGGSGRPGNMKISVDYPTGQDSQYPVSITIDPRNDGDAARRDFGGSSSSRRIRLGDDTDRNRDRDRYRGSGVPEELYESSSRGGHTLYDDGTGHTSSGRPPTGYGSASASYKPASGSHAQLHAQDDHTARTGENLWLDSYQPDLTTHDRVRFIDSNEQHFRGSSSSGTRVGRAGATVDAEEEEEEEEEEKDFARIPRINNSGVGGNRSRDLQQQRQQQKLVPDPGRSIIEAVDQLSSLSRRSTDPKIVSRQQSSSQRNSGGNINNRSRGSRGGGRYVTSSADRDRVLYGDLLTGNGRDFDASEGAMNSSHYLNSSSSRGGSSSLPRGILKSSATSFPPAAPSRGFATQEVASNSNSSNRYGSSRRSGDAGGEIGSGEGEGQDSGERGSASGLRARLGDSGALMEAIRPSKAELVRRSWPTEMQPPSSDAIAKFVDLLLAQESGTTRKEYELYGEIRKGRQMKRRKRSSDDDGAGDGTGYDEDDEVGGAGWSGPGESLSELKINPVKCTMPLVLPDAVLSEAVAESILENDVSATGLLGSAIEELNDLMRQCLLGSRIDSASTADTANRGGGGGSGGTRETSADFDHALQGVMSSIIHRVLSLLEDAVDSAVIRALESCNGYGNGDSADEAHTNIGLLLQQCIDSLKRINSFMLGSYLEEESAMLRPGHMYEIFALCLSALLNKLDACNVAVWSIGQRADEVAMEHVAANSAGGFLKASLSLELEELRRMKRDSDLTPLVERIRQQESNIIERKILRFHRVFELLLGFQVKAALWKWRDTVRLIKDHELRLHDLTERLHLGTKRAFFADWLQQWRVKAHYRKILGRMFRISGFKALLAVRPYFQRWVRRCRGEQQDAKVSAEAAGLRIELCNLKAAMHDLTQKDDVAASLAAERALNRELSAMNLELRSSLQRLEQQLLESADVPASKRKDLAYNFLIHKEEELAEAHRENKFLHSELEHLKLLAARRIQQQQQSGPSASKTATLTTTSDGARSGGRTLPSTSPTAAQPNYQHNIASGSAAATAAARDGAWVPKYQNKPAVRYDPNRYVGERNSGRRFAMSKDEALQVILSEVRRLKVSHASVQEDRNQLNMKLVEETNRNVQLTLAVQSLQGRLTAMERSANALRELLRQKLGDQGVLHLMAALEQLGAGSNALLEVPATSASTALTGEGDGGGDANNSGRGGGGRDVEQSNGFYPGNRVRIADDRISVSAPLGSARNSESGRSGNISRNQRMDLLHSAEDRDEDGSRGSSTAESKAYSRGGIHRSDGRRKDSYAKAIDGAIYR